MSVQEQKKNSARLKATLITLEGKYIMASYQISNEKTIIKELSSNSSAKKVSVAMMCIM